MKKCNVYPSLSECQMCTDCADYFHQIPNCSECSTKKEVYSLIEITSGLFGKIYGIVQDKNGKVHKCDIDLIRNITEE